MFPGREDDGVRGSLRLWLRAHGCRMGVDGGTRAGATGSVVPVAVAVRLEGDQPVAQEAFLHCHMLFP